MTEPTNAVIALAQKGDRQAFYQIYQSYIGRVYAVCWRLLGDRQKAEDAAQEIFIKVWQHLPGFKGESSFTTWLRAIANRAAIDQWRKDKHLHFADASDIDRLVELDTNTGGGSAHDMDADSRDLERAIQRLPAQAKAVFVLVALEGYQHNEVAELLGIAEGSSKAHYHRARTLLKEYLSEN